MLKKLIESSLSQSPEVEHEVISLRSHGVIGPSLAAAGIKVTALGMQGPLTAPRSLLRLWRMLSKQSPDTIVQTWLYHADLIGGILARLAGLKKVFWNLRVSVDRPIFKLLTLMILRANAKLSGLVPLRIINCGSVVMETHAREGYRRDRCIVIPNGFDLRKFDVPQGTRERVRNELGVDVSILLVATVARMHPQKDYATLARAIAMSERALPEMRFLWVGEGVDTDLGISRMLNALGVDDRIIRLGLRKDIPELLSSADIFCMASRSEGFPNALGEAMGCGLPCISTDAGDATLLLKSEDWIAPISDPSALSQLLVRMGGLSGAERRSLGIHNRYRLRENFSIDETWRRYLSIYRETA